MSRFTVTAVFTVDVPAGTSDNLVANEARSLLQNTIGRRFGYGSRYDNQQESATLDSVTVEVAPEPEPTVTLTESELQATIAECVRQALESNATGV